jgi:hypothetical protein
LFGMKTRTHVHVDDGEVIVAGLCAGIFAEVKLGGGL